MHNQSIAYCFTVIQMGRAGWIYNVGLYLGAGNLKDIVRLDMSRKVH